MEIKKIDIHAHVTYNKEQFPMRKWVDPDTLIELYDALGIERGIILPTTNINGAPEDVVNADAAAVCRNYPDRFSRFCCICADDPDALKKLEKYKLEGAVGLGEVTTNKYFDSPEYDRLLSAAEECGLPVLFHVSPAIGEGYGVVDEEGLPRLEKMLKKHKDLIFIGHSKPFWYEISDEEGADRRKCSESKVKEGRLHKLMREYGNLYCDLSAKSGSNAMMRDEEHAAKFIAEFSDRIMYGCDIVVPTVSYPFEFSKFLSEMAEKGEISEENYLKICRKNAERLFGI